MQTDAADCTKSEVRCCNSCHRPFKNGEYWFSCIDCSNYKLCGTCKTTSQLAHSHEMVRKYSADYGIEKICTLIDTSSRILSVIYFCRDRPCLGIRDKSDTDANDYANSYSWHTFETIGDRIQKFSYGLQNLIKTHQYLGICAANRPEWLVADLACILQGIISVPIYHQLSNREIAFIIKNSNISVIVCDKLLVSKFIELHLECSTLHKIICMDEIDENIFKIGQYSDSLSIHSMVEIEKLGLSKPKEYVINEPNDWITVVYTSGSSGCPKGAIISEKAFRAIFPFQNLSNVNERVKFCYRPLAWITDRKGIIATFLDGGCTGFSTGDIFRLMDELVLVSPTIFAAQPAFWNKIYSEFKTTLYSMTEPNEEYLLEQFSKLIPTRCRVLSIGGAMVNPVVIDFMRRCFRHCQIVEAYGTTESGGISINYTFYRTMIDYRLEPVTDMGYTLDNKPFPRGELLIKTVQMFSGYINDPDETKAAFTDDGFFRTGDIVELRKDENGKSKIHVIDRKKNFLKLSQGQYVSPEYLESVYMQSLFIKQIYIYGNGLDGCVKAVVVPNREYMQIFALEHSLKYIDENNPQQLFYDAIMDDFNRIAAQESLRKHEIPSKIIIEFEPFTPENGFLTLSMKLCRHKLGAQYSSKLKDNNSIRNRLKIIVENIIGRQLLTNVEGDSFINIGGDSLASLRLSRMIHNDIGVSIPLDLLVKQNINFQQLIEYIEDPSISSSTTKSLISRLWNDANLQLNIEIDQTCQIVNDSPSRIFLTGATGFVGAFLLAEMLKQYSTSCRFVCLVRSKNSNEALNRIRENMVFYQLPSENLTERIIALSGDLTKAKFGLDDDTYEDLARNVDIIFHCGAIVNFVRSYNTLYDSNVNGTLEIIRLATHNHKRIPIQYISTMSVLPREITENISIDNISPDHLKNGYAQSKWVAEKLFSSASHSGVPVVIYRLGRMGPSTETGVCNPNDFNTLLISTIMQIGFYPETIIKKRLNDLPINIACQSIITLDHIRSNMYGKIHHIFNENSSIVFETVFESICHYGLRLQSVSSEEWYEKLTWKSKENASSQSINELFLVYSFKQAHNEANLQKQSNSSSINISSISTDWIMKWLSFIQNHVNKS